MPYYQLIVRDKISLGRSCVDDDLKQLNCFYPSPLFYWDGSLASLDTIIDELRKSFGHFVDWNARLVVIE